MLLIAMLVAAGVAIVGLLLIKGDEKAARQESKPEPKIEEPVTKQDPVQRLSETLQALRKLSELRDEEIAGDPARAARAETVEPASEPAAVTPEPQERVPDRIDPVIEPVRDLRMLVGEAFSPSAPVSRRDLFAGRNQQMEDLVDTVYERGQHAVIYGERGVGKTSLASVMTRVFDGQETQLGVRVNCDSSDTYSHIWQKIFEQIAETARPLLPERSADIEATMSELSAKEDLLPNDVRRGLNDLAAAKECVVFIDEFDTVRDPDVSRLFADTIKMLSDQLVPATIVIIGVADDLDDLIQEHGSVRRALVQIHMPRMSEAELKEVVDQGLELLNMKGTTDALDRITHLSQGFPHYTHLLAQAATRAAIDAHRETVELEDVTQAVSRVLDRVHQSIREGFESAVSSSQDSIYEEVLTGAALAPRDERGYFAAASVKRPLSKLMGKTYETAKFLRHLNAMTDEQRGAALQRKGTDHHVKFRFTDPLLQPYVVMRGIQSGLVSEELLEEFSAQS